MTDDRRQKTEDRWPMMKRLKGRLPGGVRPPSSVVSVVRSPARLVIATHNPGKLAEMRELLAPYGIDATSAGELRLKEPDETGMTFHDNARIKAQAAAKATGLPAFADNSGLVVDALDGAPGVQSARWAGPDKNFRRAMATVEEKLRQCGATTAERAAAPTLSRRCASPGRTAMSRNSRRASPARWYGRRAATRALVMIRCSCRTATRARSAKCRATKNTDCRRAERAYRIAPAPSSSSRRRAFPPRLRERSARQRVGAKRRPMTGSARREGASRDRRASRWPLPDPPQAGEGEGKFGVYVHWPFCLSKCPYCDFNSHVRREPIDEARFCARTPRRSRRRRRACRGGPFPRSSLAAARPR